MTASFSRFPDLPLELRLMIWKHTIVSRIVEVHWASPDGFTFNSYQPAALRACKESRAAVHPSYYDGSVLKRYGKETPFNFRRDILYFPYVSLCSTSYGRSLEAFFSCIESRHMLRHLALSLPLDKEVGYAGVDIIDGQPFLLGIAQTGGRGSTTIFNRVQAIARRAGPLSLKSLTLVFGDPIMADDQAPTITRTWDIASSSRSMSRNDLNSEKQQRVVHIDPGVARAFKEIKMADEASHQLWDTRIAHFNWHLGRPHDAPADPYMPRENHSWMGPEFEVQARLVDRIYH